MVMTKAILAVLWEFLSLARVLPSMIGASYCCHVTLLILLLALRLTVANTPSTSSSSSQSLSSSAPSSQFSSLTSQPPSGTISSTFSVTQIRTKTTTIAKSASIPPSPSDSQSETLSQSGDQSQHGVSILTSNQITISQHIMQVTASPKTTSQSPQRKLTESSALQNSTKFHLTASKKDKKQLEAIEQLFLNNLGLSKRPRISKKYAVPEYMLDLYNIHSQYSRGRHRKSHLQAKGKGLLAGNTVRSFLHTDSESGTCLPPHCSRVLFDVSTIPEQETLVGAELRIFVAAAVDTLREDGSTTSRSGSVTSELDKHSISRDGATIRIEVHEIMRPATQGGDAISRLLDTQIVSPENSSWQSFDIRPAVLRWKRDRSHNHGLEIKIVGKSSNSLTHNHLRLRRSVHTTDNDWALQRPLLVAFTNDGLSSASNSKATSSSSSFKSQQMTTLKRKRRQASEDENKNNKRNRRKNKKKRRRKKKGNKNVCKRHGLYVDFNEVGWNDWIVAPSGFAAYYCHGDCMAPLPQFTKASAHAMLQARVYKVSPNTVPMVCCVPTTMSGISLLYMDEKGRTVLRNYQDMVVNECSCQ